MAESSDSEEFYDAEEFTPTKGSKRSSICQNIIVTGIADTPDKDKPIVKTSEDEEISVTLELAHREDTQSTEDDDQNLVKNVVQDRRRFQELRRCMQAEDEDDPPDAAGSLDRGAETLEHPFKVIAHDAMSLQSMTSLGRIGRILSGAAESHPNIRDSVVPLASSREPSNLSDDPSTLERTQTGMCGVLATVEPDVIASTKANSLKHRSAAPVVAAAGRPVAPPRRKKRNKLHGSQSLSTTDGDNLSVCTTDTEEYRYVPRAEPREKPATLDTLNTEVSHSNNQGGLPSPASTIESLTREFQDSLEMSQNIFDKSTTSLSEYHEARQSIERVSSTCSRTSTGRRETQDTAKNHSVSHVQDEERGRGGSRTHSESRANAPAGGHSSLGSNGRCGSGSTKGAAAGSRRRSAGDEATLRLAPLSDIEILEQVTVLNLDTGERMPLSVAEHKLPQCINPLSLHIMRLTSEYIGRQNDEENTRETDEESESVCGAVGTEDETKETKRESSDKQTTIRRKTENISDTHYDTPTHVRVDSFRSKQYDLTNDRLKRFLGSTVKRTVVAARTLAAEVSHARHKEDVGEIASEVRAEPPIRLKASASHRGPYDFDQCVRHVQEMSSAHTGAVWCCKFSLCGRLLATAGQDKLLRVWVTRDARSMFQDMRTKYNAEQKCSPSPSQESLSCPPPASPEPLPPSAIFCETPFCVYSGHTSDLLDISWSKNYFILSSSMDKTVRLWHISRGECLCCFQHIDFVTAIVFHPKDDRYFLSGSLDGKLRLWDIPDKKVAVWNEVDGKTKLITAANFCQNGKFAVVGTYDGRCIFYTTDQLKYHTQIDVRSTRGKNSTGRKISGVEPMPNDDKILVTSNDSRIRLYDLRDLNLSCKYKGYVNVSSQIKASFSHDGKYIVSGSENQCIYIWKTYHDYSKFTSVRRDRNDFWEGIKAHNAVVTCAIFAPNPDYMIKTITEREEEAKLASKETCDKEEAKAMEGGMVSSSQTGHVLVSADFNGCIKVFVHKAKPKHSSLPASALA